MLQDRLTIDQHSLLFTAALFSRVKSSSQCVINRLIHFNSIFSFVIISTFLKVHCRFSMCFHFVCYGYCSIRWGHLFMNKFIIFQFVSLSLSSILTFFLFAFRSLNPFIYEMVKHLNGTYFIVSYLIQVNKPTKQKKFLISFLSAFFFF